MNATVHADRTRADDLAWRRLRDTAAAPYRAAGRFAWHFARGKLGGDPGFRIMLQRGDLGQGGRIVDIGCGQGLLMNLLRGSAALTRSGHWPPSWPAAPVVTAYTGIDLMPRDVQRAQASVGAVVLPGGEPPRFVCGDMRHAELPACDVVVILDVMHYVDHAAQDALLQRVRDVLRPDGRLLLRVGDMADAGRFRVSKWIDVIVAWGRGNRVPRTYGRSLGQWQAALQALGFRVEAAPMSAGTPFANVLLVATL